MLKENVATVGVLVSNERQGSTIGPAASRFSAIDDISRICLRNVPPFEYESASKAFGNPARWEIDDNRSDISKFVRCTDATAADNRVQ